MLPTHYCCYLTCHCTVCSEARSSEAPTVCAAVVLPSYGFYLSLLLALWWLSVSVYVYLAQPSRVDNAIMYSKPDPCKLLPRTARQQMRRAARLVLPARNIRTHRETVRVAGVGTLCTADCIRVESVSACEASKQSWSYCLHTVYCIIYH
jgi:hypothetical protein